MQDPMEKITKDKKGWEHNSVGKCKTLSSKPKYHHYQQKKDKR
jgi:hypothetical protein